MPVVFSQISLLRNPCRYTTIGMVSLPSSTSIVCQVSMAFPICSFLPHLSARGGLDDPGTFLLVPPGSTRDTVMRDMAHHPEQEVPCVAPHLRNIRNSRPVSILNGTPGGARLYSVKIVRKRNTSFARTLLVEPFVIRSRVGRVFLPIGKRELLHQ